MSQRKLIVTHHSPDLDAIGAVWILTKFDAQTYADAKFAFVNPGERISQQQAEQLGSSLHQATHVDTGLGKFDHHQPDRAHQNTCAAKLVYEHVCQVHPDLKQDITLKKLVEFINDIDHFQEIHWPDAANERYVFMIHELIRGHELTDRNNDESQLHFGLQCLDYAFLALQQTIKANQIIEDKGINFQLGQTPCLALETANDDTIKQAQKLGYGLVIRKDPKQGHVRIKARPDSNFVLKPLYDKIKEIDDTGSWYYHPGGKMLLNGSISHRDQKPTPLTLKQIIKIVKQIYGSR